MTLDVDSYIQEYIANRYWRGWITGFGRRVHDTSWNHGTVYECDVMVTRMDNQHFPCSWTSSTYRTRIDRIHDKSQCARVYRRRFCFFLSVQSLLVLFIFVLFDILLHHIPYGIIEPDRLFPIHQFGNLGDIVPSTCHQTTQDQPAMKVLFPH